MREESYTLFNLIALNGTSYKKLVGEKKLLNQIFIVLGFFFIKNKTITLQYALICYQLMHYLTQANNEEYICTSLLMLVNILNSTLC